MKIIDNCLHQSLYSDLVFLSKCIDYKFSDTTTESTDNRPSFSFNAVGNEIYINPTLTAVAYLVKVALINAGENISDSIHRLRFTVLTPSNLGANLPHVDSTENHKVALFYLNESDGNTIIYNKKYRGEETRQSDFSNLKIAHEIEPKQNRMILFNGDNIHCSTPPKEYSFRSILNVNYL